MRSTERTRLRRWKIGSSIFLFVFMVFFLGVKGTLSLVWAGPNEDLFRASVMGNVNGIKAALANGADVNAKDNSGTSVLMSAVESRFEANAFESGLIKTVQLLLDHGADVNAKNKSGQTALMFSAREGYVNVTRLLLKSGADVKARDSYGDTALIAAIHLPETKGLVQLLLDHGADVNAKGRYGNTALMDAASFGEFESTRLLLKSGADVNAKDGHGRTAEDIAHNKNYTTIAALIKKNSRSTQKSDANANADLLKANERDDLNSEVPIVHHGSLVEWQCHQQIKWYNFFKYKRMQGMPKYKALDIMERYKKHISTDVFMGAIFPAESYIYSLPLDELKFFDPSRDLSNCKYAVHDETYYKFHRRKPVSSLSSRIGDPTPSMSRKIRFIVKHQEPNFCTDLATATGGFINNKYNDMPETVAKNRLKKWISIKSENAKRIDQINRNERISKTREYNKYKYKYMQKVYYYIIHKIYRFNTDELISPMGSSALYTDVYIWCGKGVNSTKTHVVIHGDH